MVDGLEQLGVLNTWMRVLEPEGPQIAVGGFDLIWFFSSSIFGGFGGFVLAMPPAL
jgi:hypothetical protein